MIKFMCDDVFVIKVGYCFGEVVDLVRMEVNVVFDYFNIVCFYYVGEIGDRLYFVMEFILGVNFGGLIWGNWLMLLEVVDYLF